MAKVGAPYGNKNAAGIRSANRKRVFKLAGAGLVGGITGGTLAHKASKSLGINHPIFTIKGAATGAVLGIGTAGKIMKRNAKRNKKRK